MVEKQKQVVSQYRVVAHLAKALARVHDDLGPTIAAGVSDNLLDMQGERSARIMETLGDILNGMDAMAEDDEWTTPIFHKAQEIWPSGAGR